MLAQTYGPTTRPIDFVHFVESTRVEQGTTAPIRVMTIHAAKGLEFDTAVLPELDNRPRYVYPVMLDRDSQTGPPVGTLPYANKGLCSLSPQLNAVYEQEHERQLLRGSMCPLRRPHMAAASSTCSCGQGQPIIPGSTPTSCGICWLRLPLDAKTETPALWLLRRPSPFRLGAVYDRLSSVGRNVRWVDLGKLVIRLPLVHLLLHAPAALDRVGHIFIELCIRRWALGVQDLQQPANRLLIPFSSRPSTAFPSLIRRETSS